MSTVSALRKDNSSKPDTRPSDSGAMTLIATQPSHIAGGLSNLTQKHTEWFVYSNFNTQMHLSRCSNPACPFFQEKPASAVN
jgi:hypothetical protein